MFSFGNLLMSVLLSFGSNCQNNYLIMSGMFAILYDVMLEFF